jgi:hypothetical protein
MQQLEVDDLSRQLQQLLPHIEVALHVRDIGADDVLIFVDRPVLCLEHADQFAGEIGLVGHFTQVVEQLTGVFYEGHRLHTVKEMDGSSVAIFRHPLLDVEELLSAVAVESLPTNHEIFGRKLAYNIAHSLTASTFLSAAMAKLQSAALGQLTVVEPATLRRFAHSITPEDVAINLSLPVLKSVPIKEVLNFRKHEAADFHAFRSALRTAIRERIYALPGADAEQVANSVYEDVLEPMLINLDRKAKKAVDLLGKMSIGSAALGAALTTVGLLTLAPVAIAGVTIGAGGLLTSYHGWLKDRREIELADLHFLWQLNNKAARHAE